MRVLHVNSYYNGSTFYKNLYDKQIKEGLNLLVYVPVSKVKTDISLEMGDYTFVSKSFNKIDRFFYYKKQRNIYSNLIKEVKISEYEITHAHSLFTNGYISLKLKKNYNLPYIVAVRNTDVNIFFKYMYHLRKLGLEILLNAENIIFLSDAYKEYTIEKFIPEKFKKEINDKAIIIPNGIADYWLNNSHTPKKYVENDKLEVLSVGNINKNENVTSTLKALSELNDYGYNINFKVVGRIESKRIFKGIDSSPFTKYYSVVKKEELINHYRNSHIFIMPSINESFGLVYAEALSQGLPIIYSQGQGFDKQFQEGQVGYHVDPLDITDIKSKIINIISHYEEMSENAINGSKKFKWDNIVYKYKEIYRSILNGI